MMSFLRSLFLFCLLGLALAAPAKADEAALREIIAKFAAT
jgi:hypothetical protein